MTYWMQGDAGRCRDKQLISVGLGTTKDIEKLKKKNT